jgi:hypothetical protein
LPFVVPAVLGLDRWLPELRVGGIVQAFGVDRDEVAHLIQTASSEQLGAAGLGEEVMTLRPPNG